MIDRSTEWMPVFFSRKLLKASFLLLALVLFACHSSVPEIVNAKTQEPIISQKPKALDALAETPALEEPESDEIPEPEDSPEPQASDEVQVVPNEDEQVKARIRDLFTLGRNYFFSREMNAAKETFLELLSLDPTDYSARSYYASSLTSLGEFEDALAVFHELEVENPEDHWVSGKLALTYSLLGDCEKAKLYYAQSNFEAQERICPRSLEAYNLLEDGQLAYEGNEYGKAEDKFRAALEIQPDHFETRLALANTLLHLKEIDAALPLFDQLETEQSDDFEVLHQKALIYSVQGKCDLAGEYYGKIGEYTPYCPRSLDAYLLFYEAERGLADAQTRLTLLEEALNLQSDYYDAAYWHAIVLIELEEFEKALEAFLL